MLQLEDRHHYTSAALNKITFTRTTFDDSLREIADKYLLGKHQEFGHIRSHVFRHASHATRTVDAHRKIYRDAKPWAFCVLPLHVPGDMALTLRSPQFLDQLGLIDYLLRNPPNGYKLAIKEHPAVVGAIDAAPP